MNKKLNYYHVDCGHFPALIKLCFDKLSFQKILDDHEIPYEASPLSDGIAETHYIGNGRNVVIILVFNLVECIDEDPSVLAGIIAHEATHCVCRVFEHIGEQPEEIGEESRAYLTEHIVRQITTGVRMHVSKHARKTNRRILKKASGESGGPEPEVDQHDNGGAGPDSASAKSDPLCGTEDGKGSDIAKAKNSVSTTG
jgi:hypothetical protein